jgi:hypothetical protein
MFFHFLDSDAQPSSQSLSKTKDFLAQHLVFRVLSSRTVMSLLHAFAVPEYHPNHKYLRDVTRYRFVAQAEIIEPKSGRRVRVLISKLGFDGCYIDVMNPLPPGTEVFVKIITRTDYFHSPATVVYSEPHLGTDLTFHSIGFGFRHILRKWLLTAMKFAAYSGKDNSDS